MLRLPVAAMIQLLHRSASAKNTHPKLRELPPTVERCLWLHCGEHEAKKAGEVFGLGRGHESVNL
jgi:hypothetical protein